MNIRINKPVWHSVVIALIIKCLLSSYVMADEPLREVNFKVEGMVTPSCPVILKAAALKINGVNWASVSRKSNTATIHFNLRQTNIKNIQQTIEQQTGFKLTTSHLTGKKVSSVNKEH